MQKKNRTREQVKEDNRKAMKSARRSYESAQKSREMCIRDRVPMVILYLVFQKQFIEGIAMTGGK